MAQFFPKVLKMYKNKQVNLACWYVVARQYFDIIISVFIIYIGTLRGLICTFVQILVVQLLIF